MNKMTERYNKRKKPAKRLKNCRRRWIESNMICKNKIEDFNKNILLIKYNPIIIDKKRQ